jgi:hypothetical protein
MPVTLHLLPGEFAICRLSSSEAVPAWAGSAVFSSVTRTADELSILCPTEQVPAGTKHDAGWRVLKFQGPFAFNETGILASVLVPLASVKISILATATFDTDYLLVKSEQLEAARRVLEQAGHVVAT